MMCCLHPRVDWPKTSPENKLLKWTFQKVYNVKSRNPGSKCASKCPSPKLPTRCGRLLGDVEYASNKQLTLSWPKTPKLTGKLGKPAATCSQVKVHPSRANAINPGLDPAFHLFRDTQKCRRHSTCGGLNVAEPEASVDVGL